VGLHGLESKRPALALAYKSGHWDQPIAGGAIARGGGAHCFAMF